MFLLDSRLNCFYDVTDAYKYQDQSFFEQNLIVDKSAKVPHPVRDLFIWCIFSEHNELAKVLWKHGNEFMGKLCCAIPSTTS